jgi:hypothetical protein
MRTRNRFSRMAGVKFNVAVTVLAAASHKTRWFVWRVAHGGLVGMANRLLSFKISFFPFCGASTNQKNSSLVPSDFTFAKIFVLTLGL